MAKSFIQLHPLFMTHLIITESISYAAVFSRYNAPRKHEQDILTSGPVVQVAVHHLSNMKLWFQF